MKRWILNSILFVLIIGLVSYLLRDINFREVFHLIKSINPFYLGAAFVVYGITFLISNYRWTRNLSTFTKVKFWQVLKIQMAGVFANTVTPGAGTGGEPIRAHYLGITYKKSRTKFFGATIADKVLNLVAFATFIIFSFSVLFLFAKIPLALKIVLQSFIAFLFIVAVIVFFLSWKKTQGSLDWVLSMIYSFFLKKRFKNLKEFKEYFENHKNNIISSFKKVLSKKRTIVYSILTSFLFWTLIFYIYHLIYLSFGFKISFISVIVVVSISQFIGDISPFPGGVGMVESTMFILYSIMAVPNHIAISVVLVARAIFYFYAIGIGGLCLIHLRLKENK